MRQAGKDLGKALKSVKINLRRKKCKSMKPITKNINDGVWVTSTNRKYSRTLPPHGRVDLKTDVDQNFTVLS